MSLGLWSLLCISGLVACSHNTATTARGPADTPAQTAIPSEPVTQPDARKNPVLTRADPDASCPPPDAGAQQPSDDERTTRSESTDDSDLGLRQRIRQAAMADGSL
jgi:hypothetical protein